MIRKEPPFWISWLTSKVYTTQFLTCCSAQVLVTLRNRYCRWMTKNTKKKSSVATKHLATLVTVPTYTVPTRLQHPVIPRNSCATLPPKLAFKLAFKLAWDVRLFVTRDRNEKSPRCRRRFQRKRFPKKICRSGQPPTRLAKVVRGQVRCQGGQVGTWWMTGLNPPGEKTCIPSWIPQDDGRLWKWTSVFHFFDVH